MSKDKKIDDQPELGGKKPIEFWHEKYTDAAKKLDKPSLPLKAIMLANGWHATGHEITEGEFTKALDAADARHG